jgi:hypothetical protein
VERREVLRREEAAAVREGPVGDRRFGHGGLRWCDNTDERGDRANNNTLRDLLPWGLRGVIPAGRGKRTKNNYAG